jgi:hypothetical protein
MSKYKGFDKECGSYRYVEARERGDTFLWLSEIYTAYLKMYGSQSVLYISDISVILKAYEIEKKEQIIFHHQGTKLLCKRSVFF